MKILNEMIAGCNSAINKNAKIPKGRYSMLGPAHLGATDSKTVSLFTKEHEHLGDVKPKKRPPPKIAKKYTPELFAKVCELVRQNLNVKPEVGKEAQGNSYIQSSIEHEVARRLKKCSKQELEELNALK